jgi:hypothetical protein
MAQVDGTIGIGQGAGNENLTGLGHVGSAIFGYLGNERVIGHYKGLGELFHPMYAFAGS